MDYNFVTVERFMELEKSGALLESGTYEGKEEAWPGALLAAVLPGPSWPGSGSRSSCRPAPPVPGPPAAPVGTILWWTR